MDSELREEIERFFLQHRRGVGSYTLARLGNAETAESITSRVFLTVVRRWHQCRASRTGWLWAIVRNEVARHFRDRRNDERLNDELADLSTSPADIALRSESLAQLRQALGQLNDEQREIVYMKFFQQMRNTEIAAATRRSPENIGVIVHRALRKLRDLMEPKASISRQSQ